MSEPIGTWQFKDRSATIVDEMRILDEMGSEGWELTSFGPFFMHFRRHEDPLMRKQWEYVRLVELTESSQRDRLERDGWTYCGRWFVLHYLKRPVPPAEA